MIAIYTYTDTLFLELDVNDNSFRLREVMGENSLYLYFTLPDYVEFPLGCYVIFQSQKYTLATPPNFNEINSRNFEYTLILGSDQDTLKNLKVKDVEGHLKFPYTASPADHLQLLINVLNTNDSGWSVGECIEANDKLISYNHIYCYDALQTIANEFNTEWEIVGKTIHLKKVEYNKENPLALSYGKGNGFVSGVGRTNDDQKKGFNVLYVQGGDRNIDFSKYGNTELLLPKSQQYTYEGVTYETDALGLSIQKAGEILTNRKEESLDASHIYPSRVGTVIDVITVDVENHFYDFTDITIPADLDFSTCRMDGEKMTVYFETGKLAGREFDIEQSDTNISGYVHSERRFKLVPKEEDGYILPNETLKPEIGDTYAVFGMMMPDAYISDDASKTGASWDMFKEACKHFYENEESKFTFRGELDGIWAKSDWVNIGGKIKVGAYISFSDTKFQPAGIDIRIISIKDYINNPHSPVIELANSVQGASIIKEIDKIKENEVVRQVLHKKSLDYTRRYFRDAKETLRLLQQAQLEFDDGINPVTVETMQLIVGSKSLQFRFVDENLDEVTHLFTYNQATSVFTADAGILQHLTLEIDAIRPNQVYKTWNVPLFESAVLDNAETSYYLYVKASKLDNTATFVLSENAVELNQIENYYYLLTGILNAEFQGDRSFVKMYGFTEILPGQIKVDKLTSGNGQQFIELLQDQIRINASVSFTNDSPALDQTRDYTTKTIQIGAHNLILDSAEIKEYYSLSAEKRDRYFNELQYYTISVDVISAVDFTGYVQAIGTKKIGGTDILATEEVVLFADKKKRIKVTFQTIINDYSQFDLKVFNLSDVEASGIVFSQPKLELGEVATDWNIAEEDTIKSINTVKDDLASAIFNFAGSIDEFFADGIISEAEANSIENYKNILNTEKIALDAKYTKIYTHTSLTGAPKTDLFNAKASFNNAHTQLLNAIDVAIADDKTTVAEKADVDAKFELYRGALQALTNALEDAARFIINTDIANGGTDITAFLAKVDWLSETLIEGNRVATGVLAVGNANGANAFISGLDEGSEAVRFVAGSSWADRFTAPFRILNDGSLFATKGTIGSWIIKDDKIVSADGGVNPTIVLDSDDGTITVRDANGRISVINKDGFLSNTGNQQVLPSSTGVTAKASMAGLGFGEVNKDLSDANFLAGVFGSASNSSVNPARTFGGYFLGLFATAVHFETRIITATTTLNASDVIVHCYNSATITVYLPANPQKGRFIEITKIYNANVFVNGNGKSILKGATYTTVELSRENSGVFRWNGSHWVYSYRE